MTDSQMPRVIRRSDPGRLVVEWADGHETVYTAAELRGLCPCAQCVDELSGIRRHDPGSVPPDLTHMDVRTVGNYALAIRFADGHDTGIFPYAFLRDRDPKG